MVGDELPPLPQPLSVQRASIGRLLLHRPELSGDWLPLFSVGCIVWLLVRSPTCARAGLRTKLRYSTMLLVTGLTTYVVGCIFGLRTDIDEALPAINACLAVGSALLLSIQLLRCDAMAATWLVCRRAFGWQLFLRCRRFGRLRTDAAHCRLGSAAGSRAQFCTMQGHATTG